MPHDKPTQASKGEESDELASKAIAQPLAVAVPPSTPVKAADAPTLVHVSASTGIDHRLQFAEQEHQYIREYIRLADQKATFFFAGSTALLAFLHQHGASARWLKPANSWSLLDGVTFAAMAALAVSALVAVGVVIPRLAGSRRGFLFFNAVAEYESSAEYASAVAELSAADVARVKLQHCYDIARVCRRKYRALRVAVVAGALGLLGALAFLLFSQP